MSNYGLKDPGSDGIVKRSGLAATTIAVPGTDYVTPSGLNKAAVGLGNADNTSDANKPVSTAQASAIAAKQATLVNGTNIKTINGASILGSGDLSVSGGGGSSIPASVSTAYASTLNLDFGSSGTSKDFTGVTGNFTVTGSNLTSNSERVIIIRKTTASQIVVSIDQTTLPAPSMQSVTDYALPANGAPPTFTLSGPSGTVFRMYFNIQGASGSFIPDVTTSALGLDFPVNTSANEGTIYNDGGSYSASASNTTENIILTIPIPANTFKAGTKMIVTYDVNTPFSGNNTTNGTQVKVRMGASGVSDPTIDDFNYKNYGTVEKATSVQFVSSTSAQVKVGYFLGSYASIANNLTPSTTKSINTAIDNNLYITVAKGAAGDVISISNITVSGKNLY